MLECLGVKNCQFAFVYLKIVIIIIVVVIIIIIINLLFNLLLYFWSSCTRKIFKSYGALNDAWCLAVCAEDRQQQHRGVHMSRGMSHHTLVRAGYLCLAASVHQVMLLVIQWGLLLVDLTLACAAPWSMFTLAASVISKI